MRNRIAFATVCAIVCTTVAPACAQNGVARPQGAPYPEIIYPDNALPLPEGFTMTRSFERPAGATVRASPDQAAINLPRDVPERLTRCWSPPPVAARRDTQVTVRLSFTRDGAVIGTPATPYLQAADEQARRALRASLLAAIKACTPMRFTQSLGRAIAGRIFAIRFVVQPAHDQRT